MSAATTTPEELEPRPNRVTAGWLWILDRPLIMLSVILVLLLIACQIASPGYMSAERVGTILQFSAPLAFLAAGQTLVMLTAGIDLSVAATATAAAYIMAGDESAVGNLERQSLEQIWNSDEMERMRRLHVAGRSGEIAWRTMASRTWRPPRPMRPGMLPANTQVRPSLVGMSPAAMPVP